MASTSKFLRVHDLTRDAPKEGESNVLKANDGYVGTIFETSFITCHRPVKSIPPPPPETEVSVYRDGSFGPHDFVCAPQWYHESIPQLAVVPLCPAPDDTQHPLYEDRCMWALLKSEDVDWTQGVISGIGRVSRKFLDPLNRSVTALKVKTETYLNDISDNSTLRSLLPLLLRRMELYADRLSSLTKDILSLRVLARGLQRTWLLLLATIRYMTIYRPLMNGSVPDSESELRVRVVGVYTSALHVVELFLPAKIPTYFMRPWSAFVNVKILSTCDVGHLGPFILPEKPLPVVFAHGQKSLEALHQMSIYVARFITYADPYSFRDARGSNSQTPAIPPPAASSSSLGPTAGPVRYTRQKVQERRDSYRAGPNAKMKTKTIKNPKINLSPTLLQDLVGGDYPPLSQNWTGMNARIDIQSTRFFDERPSKHQYAFPPPGMFVGTAKSTDYFAQYRYLRDVLIYRVASSSPMLPTQQWRTILGLRTSEKSGNPQSLARASFDEAKKVLGKCFEMQGMEFQQSLVAPPEMGETEAEERRLILWEISQIGFRSDLCRVDSRLYKNPKHSIAYEQDEALGADLDHSTKLLSIFPEKSLTAVDANRALSGLHDPEWALRSLYLEKWRDVMAEWAVPLPETLKGDAPFRDGELWERALIGHYLQLAYDVLGRPPIIPFTLNPTLSL